MFGAISMLSVGIMEMRQVEQYIDLTKITDEQLLNHPLFVHNFSMCILSITVMILYLLQAWILLDVWLWVSMNLYKKEKKKEKYESYKFYHLSIVLTRCNGFKLVVMLYDYDIKR